MTTAIKEGSIKMKIRQFPGKDVFRRLSIENNIVPVCTEILADTDTPVSLLKKFHDVRKGTSTADIKGYGDQLANWSGTIPRNLRSQYQRYLDWYKSQKFANGGMAGYAAGGVPSDNFRLVRGPGGPKEDKIPARVNRTVEARLSDGEVVFPAVTVKAAGNGDPTRGAKALMQLSDALRGSKQAHLEIEKVKKRK